MDAKTSRIDSQPGKRFGFDSASDFLDALSPETIAELIGAAADIALLVEDGIIKDIAFTESSRLEHDNCNEWRGKRWIDTVTPESRPKIESLLNGDTTETHWRQVNHPSGSARDVPVKYNTVHVSGPQRLVAFGQDLTSVSVLQQKLIGAHQDLERDYSRMRMAEGRYRLLFNSSAEGILIVNADDWTIEEANASAEDIIEIVRPDLIAKPIGSIFDASFAGRLNTLIASAATQGAASDTDLLMKNGTRINLSGTAFNEGAKKRVILRLGSDENRPPQSSDHPSLERMIDHLPDGLIIADDDQRILRINSTFAHSVQLASAQDAKGIALAKYLGRSATDINVIYSTLKKNGFIKNFATVARDQFGSEEKVEISAVSAPFNARTVYAFSVRTVSRRLGQSTALDAQLPNSTTDFTELVGRVPLKQIVNESTVLIERLCIEAALGLSDNNRAAAAEILGLSRQGLYSKLKRVGLDADD
jgi:transcriptional regulator PpsR